MCTKVPCKCTKNMLHCFYRSEFLKQDILQNKREEIEMKIIKKFLTAVMVGLCLLSAHSLCTFAAGNVVIKNDNSGIPDKELYRSVLNELGKKKNQEFTVEEAESITELTVKTKRGIKTLKGIECLTQLKTLRVSSCHLKTLKGVEKLPNLTQIVACYNELKDLRSIKNLKNLQGLCVEENKLTSLKGIENLTNLTHLEAQNNKLKSLKELKNLKRLKYLKVSENRLTSLKGIENLKSLKNLYVGSNRLKSLKEIRKLRKIRSLEVSHNELKSLEELKSIKTLSYLNAAHNKIKKLPNLSKNGKMNISLCDITFNCLSEKEIRNKLPEKFFRKGKLREEWIEKQMFYQNISDTIEITEPQDGRITKNTTKIVGRIHKGAGIRLHNRTKDIWTDVVTADENGIFVMDNLNLQTWAGDEIEFEYADIKLAEAVTFSPVTVAE